MTKIDTGPRRLGLSKVDPATVRKTDSIDHTPETRKDGVAYARKYVDATSHFSGFRRRSGLLFYRSGKLEGRT